MASHIRKSPNPRKLGLACGIGAALLGLLYLFLAGAPITMLAVNAGALVLGLCAVAVARAVPSNLPRFADTSAMLMAIVLLVIAIAGEASHGAMRWLILGPLVIQPSLVLLPAMIMGFVHRRSVLATIALAIAALALALQPDRAMAGMLALGLSMLCLLKPDRNALLALGASWLAFAVTLFRPDELPAVPYVDQVYYTAFAVGPVAGLAVIGGSILLLVPAIAWVVRRDIGRETCLVFGAIWLAAILSAALGNYPTPVVGYSGAAVLGYMLSLVHLPASSASSARTIEASHGGSSGKENDGDFLGRSVGVLGPAA